MLLAEDIGRVRLLTLARPESSNAFDAELYLATAGAFESAAADAAISVVVLTGQGRSFTAGTDLNEMAALTPGADREPGGGPDGGSMNPGIPFASFIDALSTFPKPLVAAVNGAGVGLGLTLLLHCDLVLMSRQARLLAPFTTMGVAPEAASSYLLPRRMGAQRAAHAVLAAGWISAEEAVDAGLALRACDPDRLLPEALELAAGIAEKPLPSLIATKQLMRDPEREGVRRALALEKAAFTELLRAPTMRELVLGQLPDRP